MHVKAQKLHNITTQHHLKRHCGEKERLILGSGTNILFTQDVVFDVLQNDIQEITLIAERENEVIVRAGGGTAWHDLVIYCAEHNLWGIENLALIPGTVGAAPIQNIGAYGVELSDSLLNVHVVNLSDGKSFVLSNDECAFSYRNSIFKQNINRWFITHIDLKLTKNAIPVLDYHDLKNFFPKNPTDPKQIVAKVSSIRRSKLPDPLDLGNAGSFFKNPIVHLDVFEALNEIDITGYEVSPRYFKISAAKLIERAGWKGYKDKNDAGVYEKHALILVNHGQALGKNIADLALLIKNDVAHKFGVSLEFEVRIL